VDSPRIFTSGISPTSVIIGVSIYIEVMVWPVSVLTKIWERGGCALARRAHQKLPELTTVPNNPFMSNKNCKEGQFIIA